MAGYLIPEILQQLGYVPEEIGDGTYKYTKEENGFSFLIENTWSKYVYRFYIEKNGFYSELMFSEDDVNAMSIPASRLIEFHEKNAIKSIEDVINKT